MTVLTYVFSAAAATTRRETLRDRADTLGVALGHICVTLAKRRKDDVAECTQLHRVARLSLADLS